MTVDLVDEAVKLAAEQPYLAGSIATFSAITVEAVYFAIGDAIGHERGSKLARRAKKGEEDALEKARELLDNPPAGAISSPSDFIRPYRNNKYRGLRENISRDEVRQQLRY